MLYSNGFLNFKETIVQHSIIWSQLFNNKCLPIRGMNNVMNIEEKRVEVKNIYIVFGNGLFVLAAFPYVSFYHLPSDTQPLALVFASIIFVLFIKDKNAKMPFCLWLLLAFFFYSLIIYFIKSDITYGLRSLGGYASLFLITFASYKTYKYVDYKTFIIIINIWLFFGITQLIYDRTFGGFLIPRLVSTEWRGGGVNSLAVEPSYYAIICFFFLVINDLLYRDGKYSRNHYMIFIVILVSQIIFSFSGLGFLFLIFYFAIQVITQIITNKNYFYIIYFSIGLVISFFLMTSIPYFIETRPGILINMIIQDPVKILFNDPSLADRFLHIVLPISSLFYSNGLGFGLGTWEKYSLYLVSSVGGVFAELAEVEFSFKGRIMSGWGTPVFELGVFGLLYPLWFLDILIKGLKANKALFPALFTGGITIFILMITAVPIAYPLLGYFCGIVLYYTFEAK